MMLCYEDSMLHGIMMKTMTLKTWKMNGICDIFLPRVEIISMEMQFFDITKKIKSDPCF